MAAQTTYAWSITMIAELYRQLYYSVWVTDSPGGASIWVCDRQIMQYGMNEAASGFVWVKISGVFVYTCYAPPSFSLFELIKQICPKAIAGDFNVGVVY